MRACLKILKGAAPEDLGRDQGGGAGASPTNGAARRCPAKALLWRLASSEKNGENPRISNLSVDSIPESLTLRAFRCKYLSPSGEINRAF
jgi:hypothetical protein